MKKIIEEKVLRANIHVHSFLANNGEYQKSPHFFPENQAKVRAIIERITGSLEADGPRKAIDFGCGTGFVIDLMRDLFDEIHGVDITQDMMKHVDLSTGNVFLHESVAENTLFENNSFDFATAYSFMDHLTDYRVFLKEAYRVLKKGGVFYSDLNPNRSFIQAMSELESKYINTSELSPALKREVLGAVHNGEYYKEVFGMDADILGWAEPGKTIEKGFDGGETIKFAQSLGFSNCTVEYEWFLGQAKVMHQQSIKDSETVEEYLKSILPISEPMFKYLRFIFIK
jgi:ubiquinone/menaquinone biosynthesis C-methylase UbiE